MIEGFGAGAGSVPRTNGFGSGRPNKIGTNPTDPDPAPQHCFLSFFFQLQSAVSVKNKTKNWNFLPLYSNPHFQCSSRKFYANQNGFGSETLVATIRKLCSQKRAWKYRKFFIIGRDLTECWLERLTANAKVATILALNPASTEYGMWNMRGGKWRSLE